MKKVLKKTNRLFHFVKGEVVEGKHNELSGNCTGLRGDCSGLSGDLDLCELTEEDRKTGIKLTDLIS